MKTLFTLSLILVTQAQVYGALVTTPNGALSGDLPRANRYPFDPRTSSMRYQQAYDSSFFGSFSNPVLITHLSFRSDVGSGGFLGAFSYTISDVELLMSTTARPSETLLSQFSANVGLDEQVVYSRSSLTLSSSFTDDGTGARTFDITIPLTDPFLYDPTEGNLLLEVRNFSAESSGFSPWVAFDAVDSPTDGISRLFQSNATSTTGNAQNLALVTQFEVTSVPEPTRASLLFLTIALTLFRRGRK